MTAVTGPRTNTPSLPTGRFEQNADGSAAEYVALEAGGAQVGNSNPLPVSTVPRTITPAKPAVTTLATGGQVQTLFAAAAITVGALVVNPATAAGQGIATAENVYYTIDGTDPSTTEGGSVFALLPGQALTLGPMATALKWVAATTGHKISAAGQ